MKFRPTIGDYLATLANPVGVFRTLFPSRDGAVSVPAFGRDLYGGLSFTAGNAAAVFRYGKDRFLKLYVRPNPYLREIYDYVSCAGSPILPRARLLRDELFVLSPGGASGLVDVVEGEWVEGKTLAQIVDPTTSRGQSSLLELPRREGEARSENGLRNEELIAAFDDLCAELRAAEWAHGDLKPENIVVQELSAAEKTPRLRMTLIDCDAMWIPSFEGRPAVELGTPPWADPARLAARSACSPSSPAGPTILAPFDKSIDDHPMEMIGNWLRHRT